MNRRDLLRNMGLTAGAAVGSSIMGSMFSSTTRAQGSTAGEQPSADQNAERPWYELGLMPDPVSDNQLLYYLGTTYLGIADIGEVLDTAKRMDASDPSSWPREWWHTADRLRRYSQTSLKQNHRISAGEALLRAANYRRAGLMHHHDPNLPEVAKQAEQSVLETSEAIKLLGRPITPVHIPYEGTTLQGYFHRSESTNAPVLIVFQGRDAWPEEVGYLAESCLKRGYHCLTVHGPGQGVSLRVQKLPFRHDWEAVVKPVVDWLVAQPGVDAKRLALMGLSFGGALAPRAAAFEPRLKLLIANPGVLNWSAAINTLLGQMIPDVMALLSTKPEIFDAAIGEVMKASPFLQWGFEDMMWKHGTSTPLALIRELERYNNEPVVERIKCHTLVVDSEAEAFSPGQADLLFKALKGPKDYLRFTSEDTGLVHCQPGAFAIASARIFDWFDEHI